MIYRAKRGSEAYEFIKVTCLAEEKESKEYKQRVIDALGFPFNHFKGYKHSNVLARKDEVISIYLPEEQAKTLDPKVWQINSIVKGEANVSPYRRTKRGKEVSQVLRSYKPVCSHFKIHETLKVKEPPLHSFSIANIQFVNEEAFVYFDNRIRADRQNLSLKEVTMTEYEQLAGINNEED